MLPLYRRSTGRQSNPDILSDGKRPGGRGRKPREQGRQRHAFFAFWRGGRGDTKRVQIPPKGSGPEWFVQLGWRGEFSAW
jgi:hypothetical protein